MLDPHFARVRPVLAGEGPRLRELRLASLAADPEAFGSTYAREVDQPALQWEERAARSEDGTEERTFVLVGDDDRWLGMALVRLDDSNDGSAILNAMWVHPQARGRRAAGALCDACAAWATEHGCRELTLQVVVDNTAARRAYEAAGFVVCGRSTWSHEGRTLEELDMVRLLTDPD